MKTPLHRNWTAWWPLLGLVAGNLAACGGGGGTTPYEAPVVPAVVLQSNVPVPIQTHSLPYAVYGGATSVPATALATVRSAQAVTDITFSPAAPFTTGLLIAKVNTYVPTWNGVAGNGGIPNKPWPSGSGGGLLSQGNFFVFCSNGVSYQPLEASNPLLEPAARAGAQVAVSDNFVLLGDIAPLYGKTFHRFDCTSTAPDTTFGDGNGHLTMTVDGQTLAPTDVAAAFSAAGYQPAPGLLPTRYKRLAYQITLNGQTQYMVVALDVDAHNIATASVLYQYN